MKDQFSVLLNDKDKYIPVEYGKQVHKVKNKIWYVSTLVELAKSMPIELRKVEDIRAVKLNLPLLKDHGVTHVELAYHMKVALEANLDYPIILASDGRLMDGHHRLIKAIALGVPEIKVVQFKIDPEPDKIVADVGTESLDPYVWDSMYMDFV